MIEKNRRWNMLLNTVTDGLLILAAYLLANFLRFGVLPYEINGVNPGLEIARRPTTWALGALYAAVLVVVLHAFHLYADSRSNGLWRQSRTIVLVNALGILAFMALLFVYRVSNFSRLALGLCYVLCCGFLIGKRLALRRIRRRQRDAGIGLKHVLLVGGGHVAAQYLKALEQNPYYGFAVDGYVAAAPSPALNCPYLGGYEKLDELLDGPGIDEAVVALDTAEVDLLPQVFAACDKQGTRITMVPFYNDYLPARPTIDTIGDCRLINVRETPFDNLGNAFVKRLFDIVGSLLLIVLTSPVMLVVAIGVKLSSPGPVLFRQERVGLNKKTFSMYKFRSMRVNADQETGWSTDRDPRKTRFGSFIRKFSLDELPQFFNVLKGDMSLVGPRPEVPYHVEHFKNEIPLYLVRQQVRPGCTGWAQVNGLRGDTDIAERIRYDIWYIENWTLALDIKIIFRTVFGGKMVNNEKLQ
ncbi:MAG: undecaprenyl-phosphate glucose phosphotransferase [Gemmiger sp.]